MSTPSRSFRPARPPDPAELEDLDPHEHAPAPRLWRSRGDRVVAGVLGGLAERFDLEARPLRLLYGLMTVVSAGALAVPYVALWAITRPHGPGPWKPRLWRSRTNTVVAGVLGGLAENLGIGANVLRVLFAAFSLGTMIIPGTLIYLVLWMVTSPADVPRRRDDTEW